MLARRSRATWFIVSGAEVAAHDVAAERKRQAGLAQPPGAHVLPEVEAVVLEGELALVDEQPDVHLAPRHGVLDLVEGHDHLHRVGLVEPEGQARGGAACRECRHACPGARLRGSAGAGVFATSRGP